MLYYLTYQMELSREKRTEVNYIPICFSLHSIVYYMTIFETCYSVSRAVLFV